MDSKDDRLNCFCYVTLVVCMDGRAQQFVYCCIACPLLVAYARNDVGIRVLHIFYKLIEHFVLCYS